MSEKIVTIRFVGTHGPEAGRRVIGFVHGLGGDSKSTWTGSNNTYWPALVRNDAAFADADVFTVEYDTHAKGWTPNVRDIAVALRGEMLEAGINRYAAMAFLGHSLGGIVLRWVLCDDALRHDGALWARTRLLMTYSSPFLGCDGARLAAYLMVESGQVKEVVAPSEMLTQLARDWKQVRQAGGKQPAVRAAWEKPRLKEDWFMSEQSSTDGCDSPFIAIPENHRNVVKPDGPQHPSHVAFAGAYRNAFAAA
jgi:hypothetical protein